MIVVGAIICVLIYVLFVAVKPTAPETNPNTPQTLIIIEQLVPIATGRLALLILAGFALKYLWKLHTVHAEQSVIYRDRLAALGIAESLLKATPELEQRREMLKSLTSVYLDFDESAFGKHRKELVSYCSRERNALTDRPLCRGRLASFIELDTKSRRSLGKARR